MPMDSTYHKNIADTDCQKDKHNDCFHCQSNAYYDKTKQFRFNKALHTLNIKPSQVMTIYWTQSI